MMGYDLAAMQAPIGPIQCAPCPLPGILAAVSVASRLGVMARRNVLAAARQAGVTVIHTREGHRPGLQDLPASKHFRSKAIGASLGPGAGACLAVLQRLLLARAVRDGRCIGIRQPIRRSSRAWKGTLAMPCVA